MAPIHAHLPTDWPAKMVATIAWLGVEDITVATIAWLGVEDITAATIAIIRVATIAIIDIDIDDVVVVVVGDHWRRCQVAVDHDSGRNMAAINNACWLCHSWSECS